MPDSSKLGVISAISYIVGDIIGSGIFVSPTDVVKYSGSVGLSLIIWAFSGILSILAALCYIELGTSIPYSGCDFAYLCFYGWEPVAFAFMWTYFIIYKPCSVAVLLKTFGSYLVQAVSPLLDISDETKATAEKLFGILLLMIMLWINFFQTTRFAAKIQVVVTCCKIASLLIIIVTGIVYICKGYVSNLTNPMAGSIWSANLVMAISSGLWSYNGYETLNYGVEELDNPKRTLLISAITGIVLVIVLYLLTNLAYLTVLGVDGMLNSADAVAESFSQQSLGAFSYAMPVIIGVVMMGSLNSSLFSSSRYFYAAARQGHMPSFMKLLNLTQHTPQPSLVIYAVLAIVMVNVDSVSELINYANFVVWFQRVFTIAGLMWIRFRKWPVNEKAVKMPIIIHVIFFLSVVFLIAVQVYTSLTVTLVGFSVAFLGLVIYFVLVRPKQLPTVFRTVDSYVMKFCQIIFYATPEAITVVNTVDPIADISKAEQFQSNIEKF